MMRRKFYVILDRNISIEHYFLFLSAKIEVSFVDRRIVPLNQFGRDSIPLYLPKKRCSRMAYRIVIVIQRDSIC